MTNGEVYVCLGVFVILCWVGLASLVCPVLGLRGIAGL